jgi:hypothetical protein
VVNDYPNTVTIHLSGSEIEGSKEVFNVSLVSKVVVLQPL